MTKRETVERIVWKKIQMIAQIKVKEPCTQLSLDCNSIADAAIDDLRLVIERHAQPAPPAPETADGN